MLQLSGLQRYEMNEQRGLQESREINFKARDDTDIGTRSPVTDLTTEPQGCPTATYLRGNNWKGAGGGWIGGFNYLAAS